MPTMFDAKKEVRMTKEDLKALKKYAKKRKMSVSYAIREAIYALLKKGEE
jgi:predicted DNA-binding protein